ncbi:MAG: tetratricopeptide repeat protein [bacterium]
MTSECTNEAIGDLITFYELNRLDEPDRCRFEKHLLECNYCCRQLQEMQPLAFAMQQSKAEILEKLEEDGINFTQQQNTLLEAAEKLSPMSGFEALRERFGRWAEVLKRPVIWMPAAATVLILILVLPLSLSRNPYLPFLDYTKAPYDYATFRGPAGQINAEARYTFERGMEEYARDNYKEAIRQLQKALQLAPEVSEYWLYLGVSHYLDRHPKAAIEALSRALLTKDEVIKSMSNWYLAQAYLSENHPEMALPLLEESVSQEGEYSALADTLLIRINAIK